MHLGDGNLDDPLPQVAIVPWCCMPHFFEAFVGFKKAVLLPQGAPER
jgi:hypothetical protein